MFCLPPRLGIDPAGLCLQGLGGICSELVLQVWSPPLIPGFGPVHSGSQAADQGVRPPRFSVVGAQVTDQGAHQLGFRCVLGLLMQCSQSRG